MLNRELRSPDSRFSIPYSKFKTSENMNKILILLSMMLVVGVGCSKAKTDVVTEPDLDLEPELVLEHSVTGWFIGGEGKQWYAYEPYDGTGMTFGAGKERSTSRDKGQAFVQNVDQPILLPERPIKEGVEYYEGDDWVLLDVLVYPVQARMPTDLELVDVEGKEVGVRRGNKFDTWYWKTGDKLYEVFFYTAEGSGITPEQVFGELYEQ